MLKKLIGGTTGLVFWLFTGGLMFVHLIFSAINAQWLLGGVGLFIPPLGIVNAVSWLVAGNNIFEYVSG